jgi:hypothetical protein
MVVIHGRSRWILAAFVAASAGVAHAADLESQIASYETETRQLATDLPRPNQLSPAAGQRRLVDAEVAYALGDYDTAAVMLFELAAKPGADQETARFFLAESLFQKADRGAARAYYELVVASGSPASKYYQPALERLIEIAIAQNDASTADQYVTALERISAAQRLPSVPYILGKLAYAQGKYDDAITFFQGVAKGSDYELQATYYTATIYVAKKDLQRATDVFTDLMGRKPRSSSERRIIELSQLALGRLYYERDQPSKSIDSYLLVDRHSDLFGDALYEVGWVYVKSKQYDKALRALELLSRSDPQSTKTPTVRILEGNLRVRKAQMIRGAQIQGTLDDHSEDDPETEYDKAVQVFTETHDMYMPSYAALARIVDSDADPAQYLTQIAGRWEHVFQAAAPMPEAAIQYLRDEPEIQRVVAVEADLGEITTNISQTEVTIARLEGVIGAGDRSAVYPALAIRRSRLGAISDDVIKIRGQLADQELALVDSSGELANLSAARKQLLAAYLAMPNAEHAVAEHLAERRAGYDAIEGGVTEIESAIGATQAMAVALRKYGNDTTTQSADQRQNVATGLDAAAREAQAIENELDALRRELQIGRDLASVGDTAMAAARSARAELRVAEDAEHKALVAMAGASRDRGRSQSLAAQGERAARLAELLDQTDYQIDAIIDQGLQEARGMLVELKTTLDAYKVELDGYEMETSAVGRTALGAGFKGVKAKLYDIVIRTDVGNVDVAWSQKADTDDDLKRLNLSRQRELKQLKDEFKDILDGGTQKPSAPAKKTPMPQPEPPPTGSPDKGAPDQRIAPGADAPSTPAPAAVRPEDAKKNPPPNKAAVKKAAPKGASR